MHDFSIATLNNFGYKTHIAISYMSDFVDFCLWYHQLMESSSEISPPENMDSEDPLFILYTSVSTGNP